MDSGYRKNKAGQVRKGKKYLSGRRVEKWEGWVGTWAVSVWHYIANNTITHLTINIIYLFTKTWIWNPWELNFTYFSLFKSNHFVRWILQCEFWTQNYNVDKSEIQCRFELYPLKIVDCFYRKSNVYSFGIVLKQFKILSFKDDLIIPLLHLIYTLNIRAQMNRKN